MTHCCWVHTHFLVRCPRHNECILLYHPIIARGELLVKNSISSKGGHQRPEYFNTHEAAVKRTEYTTHVISTRPKLIKPSPCWNAKYQVRD